jgi:predicted nucleic acid-binding protein
MRLVLDTNILIAALIKDSITRRILLLPDLEFLLPAFALDELAKHRGKIVRFARLKGDELDLLLTLLLMSVTSFPLSVSHHIFQRLTH